MNEPLPFRVQNASMHQRRTHSVSSNQGSLSSGSQPASQYAFSTHGSVAQHSHRGSYTSQQISAASETVLERPRRRLKSQYPSNSIDPHVEYILVASFDIDRGPIMEHQFPGAISSDENMLAELMLPDQTHVRKQDWTMFFLHKDAGNGDEDIMENGPRRTKQGDRAENGETDTEDASDDSGSDVSEAESIESSPLMYVLNLVNTKQDSTAKRGAVVKAMAICTRHSFLHIYKPLLLLALEDYFKNPDTHTLELLYNSLNAMDLSLMPRLSILERHILQATDTKDMFAEKFEQMIAQRLEDEANGKRPDVPESPLRNTPRYIIPRDTHEFETKITYNEIPIPVKIPTALMPETVGDFSIITLIQTFGNPHISQPQPFTLHPHLTTSGVYTHPILVLINAMLTQKRVIFLGHNRPSAEVSEAVVAACALASGGVLRGFTRHAFPYTDLTKIDELLKVPGFIAGVTNPAFLYHPEWWDVLCDLPSGRMKISSNIDVAPVTEGSTYFQSHHHPANSSSQKDSNQDATGDAAFMEDINRSIASRQGEPIIRAKFRAYVTKFTRIAAAFEELVYGASSLSVISPTEVDKVEPPKTSHSNPSVKRMSLQSSSENLKGHGYVWPSEEAKYRELSASAARIEGWRNTRSYYAFISDLANYAKNPASPSSSISMANMLAVRPLKQHVDIYHCLSKLRILRLPPQDAGAIYLALEAYCDDYETILELLNNAPMSEAGLFYVSLGLWHEDVRVRDAVTHLLCRIKSHPAGKIFFARLGGWAHAGFKSCLQDKQSRTQNQQESEDFITSFDMRLKINEGD